ncbi:unnamed protein product [Urochloa decumbens]|uniref:Uncharacterized protein n=1 Tax=Urochloa decumbens TaxID=240449 RepID=A0ABC9AI98_9POAL
MAAAVPCTVRLRERATAAEESSERAHGLLRTAAASLALPMHIDDAPGARARAEHAGVELTEACRALASAATTAAAAEILALRGAAADPAAPLHSVADIPDAHESERSAVGMLREAKVYAEGAYDTVGWSLDRLLVAHSLLEHPGLPGVDELLDAERAAAHGYLVVAENLAGVSSAYAYTALCFMFPELDLEF